MGKADLHVHTRWSPDSFSSVKAVLKKAKERQLDVVAITDHETIKGAKEAKKMAPEFGLEVIVGQEVATKEGDLLALFIEEKVKAGRPVLETAAEIHKQGGLAAVPHPDNWFVGGVPEKVLLNTFEELDGLELLNGSWLGWINKEKVEKLNGSTFNLAGLGGSDAHLASQVGSSWTEFPGKTAKDLFLAIRGKETIPVGTHWALKHKALWLVNSPRLIYRCPHLPLLTALRVLKKVL